jgi:hypothetical protein
MSCENNLAQIILNYPMPLLSEDFIEFVNKRIEHQRPDLNALDRKTLLEAFQRFGARPQFFLEAIGQLLSPFSGITEKWEAAILHAADEQQKRDRAQMESDYLGLNPVERSVLWRLLEKGSRFRPYDADALNFYSIKAERRVSVPLAQKALASLRDREPPLVWKSAHGEYAVEDTAMHAWFDQRVAEKSWPPIDPYAQDVQSEGASRKRKKRRSPTRRILRKKFRKK